VSTDRSSLEKAFEAAQGESGVLGAAMSPEQLDLLRDDRGQLPANVYQMARRAGPGRKPGSRNKRSDDLARIITQDFGCPVRFQASIYAMPTDQITELLLKADPTVGAREERLMALADEMTATLRDARHAIRKMPDQGTSEAFKRLDKIIELAERVEDVARTLRTKAGEIAVKALSLQLQAAKSVAEYVHSKKPVQAEVKVGVDGVIVMPGANVLGASPVDQVLGRVAEALNSGAIDPAQLRDMRIVDGEFSDIDAVDEDNDD
jgi:hypothetical protein